MICKPMGDTQLGNMNGLQRATESFRYVALVIEWWVSPNGHLRQWLMANVKLTVCMAIPTFMVLPVIILTLWELSSCIHSMTTIAGKIIVLPVLALISIMVVFKIFGVFKR